MRLWPKLKKYAAVILIAAMAFILNGCSVTGNIKELCEYIENGENSKAEEIIEKTGNLNRESRAFRGLRLFFSQGEQQASTPLCSACKSGNAAMVKLLLEHGADPNFTGKGLAKPLEVYCAENIDADTAILELLLQYGAKVNDYAYEPAVFRVADKLKYLNSEKAAAAGRMITYLLDNGASLVYEENGTTRTLLFCAVQGPDAKLLKTLLDEYNVSACIDVEDDEGETALDIAEALNFQEAVDLLQQYRAGIPD